MAHDLSISELVVQSLRILRTQTDSAPETLSSRKILPKSYLRWLRDNLDATSIAVYLFGRNGLLSETLRLGTDIPGIIRSYDLARSLFGDLTWLRATEGKVIVAELSDAQRARRGLSPSFGFVVIYRETGFSVEEFDILHELAQFVGAYLLYRERLFAAFRSDRTRRAIDAIAVSDWRPGTRLAAGIRHIYHGTGASYAAFGVVDRDDFRLVYIRRPQYQGNAKFLPEAAPMRLPKAVSERLVSGRHEALRTEEEKTLFRDVLGIPSGYGEPVFRLLVAPILDGRRPIAAFLLAVSTHVIEYQESEALQLTRFATEQLARDIRAVYTGITNQMIVEPVFRSRHDDVEPNEVFVLMPFGEAWSTRIWERFVRPVCESEGFTARRADDLYGADIMEDIWTSICRARIVIADITRRNPNVFYELGIAHTLGKDVVLLTQDVNDIPFDLNRYRHIVYADNMDGYDKLARALTGTLREIARR